MSCRTDKFVKHAQVHQRSGLRIMTRMTLICLGLLSIALLRVIHNRADSIQSRLSPTRCAIYSIE